MSRSTATDRDARVLASQAEIPEHEPLERGSQSILLEQLRPVLGGAVHDSVQGVHENECRGFGVVERELCASRL